MAKGFAAKTISNAALAVLDNVEVDGMVARITSGQLDRKVYEQVNEALVACGGKWNRGKKGHLFASDPRTSIESMVLTGQFVDAKKLYQAFYTPAPLARRLVAMADIKPGMRVLEPSVGKLAIVFAIAALRLEGVVMVLCEIDPAIVAVHRKSNLAVHCGDFLSGIVDEHCPVDRAVMNPPFVAPGAPQVDIDHVRHAFKLLKPGGRLVSVMSGGILFRDNAKTTTFKRDLLDRYGEAEELDVGAFAESGTNVNACIVTLDKPRA